MLINFENYAKKIKKFVFVKIKQDNLKLNQVSFHCV